MYGCACSLAARLNFFFTGGRLLPVSGNQVQNANDECSGPTIPACKLFMYLTFSLWCVFPPSFFWRRDNVALPHPSFFGKSSSHDPINLKPEFFWVFLGFFQGVLKPTRSLQPTVTCFSWAGIVFMFFLWTGFPGKFLWAYLVIIIHN